MSKRVDVNLVDFFIFNSNFGPREGEEEKRILYFYPPATHIDTKIKHVGLCEAITKFTQSFTDSACDSLHTQKTRQVLFEAEPEFWIIMTVSIPYSQRMKDGQTYTEYHQDDVQDNVFQAILRQAYKMFRIFNGTICDIVEKGNVDLLKQRFELFYSKYLLTLRLSQADILDVMHGIHFLPLDKNTYLRIQCFINLLEATFVRVKYTAFLFNDQLVWSGLEQEDMRTLYTYLTTSLFPAYMEQELSSSGAPQPATQHYGKYILGPPNMQNERDMGKIPRIFLHSDTEAEECWLLVYRTLNASICLFLDGGTQLSFEYMRRLDKFLAPHLSNIDTAIGDQHTKKPNTADVQFRYIYFNRMNLAQKTTVHTDNKKISNTNIPQDVLCLLADFNHDLNNVLEVEDGETIVKTCSDCWVVSKKSDQREFYVVLTQRNANLIEINEEVKKLCMTSFSNIFFLD